jgi:lipopolysaccharide export system ATP-binding protein
MAIAEIESALGFFKDGMPEKAIPVLEEVVELVPTYVIAHVLLAQAYEASLQEDKAIAAWRRAYRMIPNSPVQPESGDEPRDDLENLMAGFTTLDETRPPLSAPGHTSAEATTINAPDVENAPTELSVTPETSGVVDVENTGSILRVHDLIKRYKKKSVVKAVELEVQQGEIVGLLGPNGAGKTTTFYMMVGMVQPDGGSVQLDGQNITGLPMYERARRGIGYLAQEASIFTHLTVEENIHAVLEYQKLNKADRVARVEDLILEFGLERVRRSKGYMLSGGERRRTEIARALATRPRFFLLDEPFAGVDPIAVEDIQRIVVSLKQRGIGVLITDHNVHETLAITDRAYLLYEGKILKQGTAEDLVADPEVRRRYLGENFTLERYS